MTFAPLLSGPVKCGCESLRGAWRSAAERRPSEMQEWEALTRPLTLASRSGLPCARSHKLDAAAEQVQQV